MRWSSWSWSQYIKNQRNPYPCKITLTKKTRVSSNRVKEVRLECKGSMPARLQAAKNASRGRTGLRLTCIGITAHSHTDVIMRAAQKLLVRNPTWESTCWSIKARGHSFANFVIKGSGRKGECRIMNIDTQEISKSNYLLEVFHIHFQLQLIHELYRPYKCDNCGNSFYRRNCLNKHIEKCK